MYLLLKNKENKYARVHTHHAYNTEKYYQDFFLLFWDGFFNTKYTQNKLRARLLFATEKNVFTWSRAKKKVGRKRSQC